MSGINTNYSSLFTNTAGAQYSMKFYNMQQSISDSKALSNYLYGVNNSTTTTTQASSITDFKDAASVIQSALASLTEKQNGGSTVFENYKATSSNSDAVSVTYNNSVDKYSSEALLARRDPNYKPSAPESLSVSVSQLAQTQKNTSNAVDTKGMELEANKTYSFEISDGNSTTTISFAAEEGDTNESIMKKIASAVNEKDIGVKASVSTNDVTGKSTLVFESRETGIDEGAERSFEIRDVSGSDAVEKLGLNNMTQEAQNAKYTVTDANGGVESRESKSNTVQLTDRTSATLKQTTNDNVKIGFEKSTTASVNAVRELVNGFNALYDAASSESTVAAARLQEQLQGLAKTYGNALSEVGITQNENGYFVIDSDKMQSAAESGALGKLFASDGAGSYGFANRLKNIADTVSNNPNQYVTGKTASSESSADYWDELNSGESSSYSKLYFNMMKYENMGALFNSMF